MSKNSIVRMLIERTKGGYPAYWESGGGISDRGEATIIAGKDGRPKKSISRGQLANCRHALVILEVGDYVINAFHYREDFEITIYRVTGFEEIDGEMYAIVEFFNGKYDMEHMICYGTPEWDAPLPAFLEAAVQAAVDKATCYHCKEPHFAIIEARNSAKYRRAAKAFFKIRNGIKIETFGSLIEGSLIEDGDIRKAVNLLKTRPGMFARSLDRLLRSCVDQYLTVTKGFEFVANKIASPVLLQVRAHFLQRNSGIPLRVFFPKGNVAKAQVVENNLTAIPQEVCDEIVRITEDAILSIYKERQPLGKIYIDERLKSYVVPFSQRSASRSLRALARGSRIPIDENTNTLRLFMYWKQPSDQSVDIDLSSVFYDSDWKYVSHISYTNLREPYACHSGDITSAPEGASEFIDLNIKEMKKCGIRYVVAAMISFTRQSYINIPECFVGWMNREAPESGEIFEPKTVQNRADITSDTRFTIPLVIDLDRMEVIWADLSLRENPLFYNNIEGNAKGTCLMGQAIVSLVRPNLYDLFMLNGLARGEIVEKKEDADVIFSVDEGITPFDMDKIVADFI